MTLIESLGTLYCELHAELNMINTANTKNNRANILTSIYEPIKEHWEHGRSLLFTLKVLKGFD